jgi:DNA-binding Xre family transcriptional regulator
MLDKSDKKYYSYHITQRFLKVVDSIVGNRSNGKITYKELCKSIGMTSSNLNRLRDSTTGDNCVTVEAIGRLCEFYKVSPATLILDISSDISGTYEALEKRVSVTESRIDKIETLVKNKIKK